MKLSNPCIKKKDFCLNCSSYFMTIRPMLKNVIVHKKFFRDLGKDKELVDSVVKLIIDCTSLEFHELHKFEKSVAGNLVFRAKQEKTHFVYCINKKNIETLLFLRAISNFPDYKRFLSNDQQIARMVTEISN